MTRMVGESGDEFSCNCNFIPNLFQIYFLLESLIGAFIASGGL